MKSIKLLCAAVITAVFTLWVSLLCGCNSGSVKTTERTAFLYDTIITIKLRGYPEADTLLDSTFRLCEQYDRLFDRFDTDSDIYRINTAKGEPCEVNEDTLHLLELGLEYSELSGGKYDITCGRVTDLWDFSSDAPSLPDPNKMAEALSTVGRQKMVIENSCVTVPDGTELDLGGIAKGYIADRIVEHLRQNGANSAVINLGGNISVLGSKEGQPFSIGIQSPFEQNGYLGYLSVSDCSVVTAGSYQRCFELDGTLYHHILDLSDGMPCRSGLSSVTVISESSAKADALATICFLLGADEGLTLINSDNEAEAVFVTDTGQIMLSEGAEEIFSPYN